MNNSISPALDRALEAAGVSLDVVARPSKRRDVVMSRRIVWAWLTLVEGWPLPQAARRTGTDHGSVLYGVRRWASQALGTPLDATLCDMRAALRDWQGALVRTPSQFEDRLVRAVRRSSDLRLPSDPVGALDLVQAVQGASGQSLPGRAA